MGSAAVGLACLCLLALVAIVGPATAGAASCPNEAFRLGPSALLPECRAYEMVSPPDKNGGNVSSRLLVRAAPDGGAVSFGSTASFADSPASPLGAYYISSRGSNWATEAIDPKQFNHGGFGLMYRASPASSPDLRFSLGASRLALTPGAQEGGSNLYLRDNATGSLTLLAANPGEALFNQASGTTGGAFLGGDADWSHILITSTEPLAVGATGPQPAAGQENLYDLAGGTVHLVNVLPNGTVDPTGAHIGEYITPEQHMISEDGSRIFFQPGFEHSVMGGLYVREDDTTTKPISVSRNGAEAGEVKPAEFRLASPDGATVYFTSFAELIEGAGNNALYRYEIPTEEMTPMVPNPPAGGPKIQTVLGASRDGSYVYFSAWAALAEGATETRGLGTNLYVWHDGTIKWIAQTVTGSESFRPPRWSVSPNGRFLGFETLTSMTAEDVPSPACPADPFIGNAPEQCLDVYVYEADSAKLTCVSCDGPGRGHSELGGTATIEVGTGDEYPRTVFDNGTVFFDSPNALLPRDTNGVGDVYAWRAGSYELISTGTSEQPSTFGNATPDGSNVYFLTKQQLVKQDTDENTDLYDDRELGGLASQWPPGSVAPCEGEGCKSTSPGPPPGLPEGSVLGASSRAAAQSCTALRVQAKKANRKARRLTAHARRAGKQVGAKSQARRLRRQAAAARKRAHRIHQKAATCGRKG